MTRTLRTRHVLLWLTVGPIFAIGLVGLISLSPGQFGINQIHDYPSLNPGPGGANQIDTDPFLSPGPGGANQIDTDPSPNRGSLFPPQGTIFPMFPAQDHK